MGSISLSAENTTDRIALTLTGLFCICGVIVVAYWSSFASMASMWTLSSFGHGYVIPFVSVALLWRNRRALGAEPSWTGSWLGVAAVGACVWGWLIARATMVQVVEHFTVVGMISASVWAVAGSAAYRPLLFPLAFLFFAVPIGDSVIPVLMQITADVSARGLHAMGVPVLREGMIMTLPRGTFEIADVCSGFQYLNAGLALGVLMAHELFRGLARQCLYVSAVIVVFIFTNGLRAFIVIMVASATDMRIFGGRDHVYFGWALFLVAILAMYWLAERFSNRKRKNEH